MTRPPLGCVSPASCGIIRENDCLRSDCANHKRPEPAPAFYIVARFEDKRLEVNINRTRHDIDVGEPDKQRMWLWLERAMPEVARLFREAAELRDRLEAA